MENFISFLKMHIKIRLYYSGRQSQQSFLLSPSTHSLHVLLSPSTHYIFLLSPSTHSLYVFFERNRMQPPPPQKIKKY
jgi:hypothetical protein